MEKQFNKDHWENIYTNKTPEEVSWTQAKPLVSLDFIHSCGLDTSASIIDIGGGDSNLVDFLLDQGFEDITVLDISAAALRNAQNRLGKKAEKINWIVCDILDFQPTKQYDIWHDRATFHFLTIPEQIAQYVGTATRSVSQYIVIGTFSVNGPTKCSGLPITQYDESQLTTTFQKDFEKLTCLTTDHTTPFNTIQNFQFCSFRKK